jgi:hypothetical protein
MSGIPEASLRYAYRFRGNPCKCDGFLFCIGQRFCGTTEREILLRLPCSWCIWLFPNSMMSTQPEHMPKDMEERR